MDKSSRPVIVCLCGSTRFYKEFQRANYNETMAGKIVLSVGFYWHSSKEAHGEEWGCTPKQKIELDELHKRKIDISDEILVINVNGYIGDSTKSEIEYAKQQGKKIRWLEPPTAKEKARRICPGAHRASYVVNCICDKLEQEILDIEKVARIKQKEEDAKIAESFKISNFEGIDTRIIHGNSAATHIAAAIRKGEKNE